MGRSHPRVTPTTRPPGYVPVTDRTPMGYARHDAEQAAIHLHGQIAALQDAVAKLSADRDAEQIVYDLQQILTTTANALTHAARLRGIRETIANFEETP